MVYTHALSHLSACIQYTIIHAYTRGIDTHRCVDIARIYGKSESERFTTTWYDCGWPSLYYLPRFSTRNKQLGIVPARTTGFCKKNTRNLYFHAEVNRRPYARDWPRSIDSFVIREISILLWIHLYIVERYYDINRNWMDRLSFYFWRYYWYYVYVASR